MRAEYAVIKILLNDTTVSGLVSTRVYLDEAPQKDPYPLIIVEEDSDDPSDTKDGPSVVDHDTVRVFPYATDPDTLRTLAKACRDALDGKANVTYNTTEVVYVRFVSQGKFSEQIENRKVFAKDQEYNVRVKV
jgi:hypothetical protein